MENCPRLKPRKDESLPWRTAQTNAFSQLFDDDDPVEPGRRSKRLPLTAPLWTRQVLRRSYVVGPRKDGPLPMPTASTCFFKPPCNVDHWMSKNEGCQLQLVCETSEANGDHDCVIHLFDNRQSTLSLYNSIMQVVNIVNYPSQYVQVYSGCFKLIGRQESPRSPNSSSTIYQKRL